ncbi:hypothetical protein [Natrinema salifodinae]|uniref:MarR family transcriptional regulator n=1 Tax=Natrinema salifodinae TaxID=1202768 RepID=A0A1I0MK28_9EURY|nr:hypothetical protein [Natrinema salifodinae]SEV88338.1 hypothetical protein SAMN05216285_1033 [Natrinema salifodinae]
MVRRALERAVLDALADEAPLYVVDLAATIDEHPVTVEHVCDRLHERGAIRSIGCRRYDLTASGRRRLTEVPPARNGADVPTETEGRP